MHGQYSSTISGPARLGWEMTTAVRHESGSAEAYRCLRSGLNSGSPPAATAPGRLSTGMHRSYGSEPAHEVPFTWHSCTTADLFLQGRPPSDDSSLFTKFAPETDEWLLFEALNAEPRPVSRSLRTVRQCSTGIHWIIRFPCGGKEYLLVLRQARDVNGGTSWPVPKNGERRAAHHGTQESS